MNSNRTISHRLALARSTTESIAVAGAALEKERAMQVRQEQATRVIEEAKRVVSQQAMAQQYEEEERGIELRAETKYRVIYGVAELGLALARVRVPRYEPPNPRPFGTLKVLIGPGGIPEDMTAINISKLARDRPATEEEVEKSIAGNNSLLLTPDQFKQLIQRVVREIMAGRLTPPVLAPQLRSGSRPYP